MRYNIVSTSPKSRRLLPSRLRRATASACGWHLGGRLLVSPNYNTNRQRKQYLCRNLCVTDRRGRRSLQFCKHPYENERKRGVGRNRRHTCRQPFACLALPRRFFSSQIGQQKSPDKRGFFIGLPERIRTFDLQSRSLTRYPAVPRVDLNTPLLYHNPYKIASPFPKKVRDSLRHSAFLPPFPSIFCPKPLSPCKKSKYNPTIFRLSSQKQGKTLDKLNNLRYN